MAWGANLELEAAVERYPFFPFRKKGVTYWPCDQFAAGGSCLEVPLFSGFGQKGCPRGLGTNMQLEAAVQGYPFFPFRAKGVPS